MHLAGTSCRSATLLAPAALLAIIRPGKDSNLCGFASVAEGGQLTPDEQFAKLQLVADTAQAIWG